MKPIALLSLLMLSLAACTSSDGGDRRTSSHREDQDRDPGGGDDGGGDDDPGVDPGANAPPHTVVVGGPPDHCVVYEVPVPLQDRPGQHHPEGTVIEYEQNPPAGGPDYEMWAAYRRYDEVVERPRWQHNLRHGAIVLIYRPDAPQEVIDALAAAYEHIPTPMGKYQADPGCPSMGIMTPDPLLDDTFAVLAFGWMMTSNCAPELGDVIDFAERHIYEGEEKECWDGAWPVREPCFRFEEVRYSEWTREVPEGSSVTYDNYPPSSGAYYGNMLQYGRYDAVVPAPYWTGLLAKGGIVVLYRPDAPPELIDGLKAAYDRLDPHWCGTTLTAMVQDDRLETPFAMVGYNQYMHAQCFRGWEMDMFVYSRRGWGPIDSCEDGTYVPPGAAPEPSPPDPTTSEPQLEPTAP